MLTGSSKGFKKLSLLIFLIFSLAGYSQVDVNSPYSRFGIGELSASNSTYSFSMGGISNALSSPFHVNLNNPASNANFDTLSFVFEGGLSASSVVSLLKPYQEVPIMHRLVISYLDFLYPEG